MKPEYQTSARHGGLQFDNARGRYVWFLSLLILKLSHIKLKLCQLNIQ